MEEKKYVPVLEMVFFGIDTKEMKKNMWDFKRHIYKNYDAGCEKQPQIYGKEIKFYSRIQI